MNKKTLVIFDSIDYLLPLIDQHRGVDARATFRKLSFPEKVVRKLWLKAGLTETIWYDDWHNNLDNYETAICFATKHSKKTIEFIRSKNRNIRIILWYWNPVKNLFPPNDIDDLWCEKWSFDADDCQKYKMNYNTTFYLKNTPIEELEISIDSLFVGLDKGRKKQLEGLEKIMRDAGLRTLFYIVEQNAKGHAAKNGRKPISYKENLELLMKSRSVVEIIQEGQSGQTIRQMESILLCKKLITNDRNVNKYDFYSPENIFILGKDKIEGVVEFIQTPYLDISKEIVDKYDFRNWLDRFYES